MIVNKKPDMPVLFVTGRHDLIEIAGYIPGEVLYKPVDLDELSRKIGERLAR